MFGTHNSDLEDLGLVLGVCAIYPDEFFFSICVCLFVPSLLSLSLHQGQFYNTTFRPQQSALWSFHLILCHVCSSKLFLTELGKKCQVPYFGEKHSVLVASIYSLSTWHTVGLYWVPGHGRVRGNEIAYEFKRDCSVQWFVGPEPFMGVCRQNIRRKMKPWVENQHLVLWRVACSTQRQAGELISDPDLATRARLLSFNRTQSRVVIGHLTGHNTLSRHLYIMGPINNPTCMKCGTEEETSLHILCECETLASFTYTCLGSFFLDPEDIRKLSIGTIWNFAKRTGLL